MGHLFSRAFRRITQCTTNQSLNQEQQQNYERQGKFSIIRYSLILHYNIYIENKRVFVIFKH